jgi:hypothetical protein
MATLDEQVDLLYNTVVRLNDIAEDSYNYARQQLDVLVDADRELQLGVVDVSIGDTANITWTGSYVAPATPVEPDLESEITVPVLPTVTAEDVEAGTLPTFSSQAPATPSVPASPVAIGAQPTWAETDPTVPAVLVPGNLEVGAQPTLNVSDPTLPEVVVPGNLEVGSVPTFVATEPTAPEVVVPANLEVGAQPTFTAQAPVVPPVVVPGNVSVGAQPTLTLGDPTVPAVVVPANLEVGAQPTLTLAEPTLPGVVVPDNLEVGAVPTFSASEPSAPAVVVPAAIGVDERPTWEVDLSGAPGTLAADSFSALPVLEALPEIAALIPSMDVSLLEIDPLNDFVEPLYSERVSSEVQAGILAVLGGDLGLPAGYWDALWAQVSADLAQQAAAESRNARNLGAASYWARPSEAVTAVMRRVNDEASKRQTLARLEQAKQQATFAREDFWQAIAKGIEYESQWLNAHDRVAQRALAAAEQLYSVRVQAHNANVARYNAMLEAAKLDGTIDDLAVRRVLGKYAAEIQGADVEVRQAGHQLERYKTEWEGYRIDKTTRVTAMAERVKFWNGQVDADIRYQTLEQEGAKLGFQLFTAKAQVFAEQIRAWTAAVEADVRYQGLAQEGAKLELQAMTTKAQVFAEQMRGWTAAVDADVKYQTLEQDGAKLNFALLDTKTRVFAEEIRAWMATLEADARYQGLKLDGAKTEMQAFQAAAQVFGEQVRGWTAAVDADVKYQGLEQDGAKLAAQLFTAKAQVFAEQIRAWTATVEADVKYQTLEQDGAKLELQAMATKAQVFAEQMRGWTAAVEADVRYQGLEQQGAKLNFELLATKAQVFAQEIQAWTSTIDADVKYRGLGLDASKTAFSAFATDAQVFGEKVRAWAAAVGANVQNQQLKLSKGKLDLDLMANQVAKVQGLSQATLGLLQARTAVGRFEMDKQTVQHAWDKDKNLIEVDLTRITQAAQEAAARIDVAQAQWLEGQGLSLKQNIAQLAYGYAQAAVAASDVSFGRSINYGYSVSGSMNAEKVWSA